MKYLPFIVFGASYVLRKPIRDACIENDRLHQATVTYRLEY